MTGRTKPRIEPERLWQGLDASEKEIVLYLAYATPPVSIDTLGSLARIPALKVLNAVENLRKKRIVYEKKEFGKGLYFLNDAGITDFLQRQIPEEETRKALRNILDDYRRSLAEEPEKTLRLAELYRKLGERGEGLACIKSAADILYSLGQNQKANLYYGYLLENFPDKWPASTEEGDTLVNILEKLSLPDYLLSVEKKVLILTRAQKVAERHANWGSLAKIKLALGRIAKETGHQEKASQYFNDSWKIAEKTGDQQILRMVALSLSDFLFWEGKVSEAVRRYEKVVGNLEEFGDDGATLKASAMLGWCYVICGRVSRGMGMIEAVRSKAYSLDLPDVVVYSDLMSALSLIEERRVTDAELYLKRVFSASPGVLSNAVLSAANGGMAYVHLAGEEFEKAYDCQKTSLDYARRPGSSFPRGSHNLECLYELEKRGLHSAEANCSGEIKRMVNGNDIYMKGVALRIRALRNIRNRQLKGRAFLDLRNSEKYLKSAGAEVELARTRIALGDAFLNEGEIRVAQSYLDKAWTLFSKVDKNLFPKDMLVIMMPQEQKIEAIIDRIIDINESLGTMRDMSSFLERVINVTMDFTMAMRGAFFTLGPGGEPMITASRNLDPLLLKADQLTLVRTVIMGVAREGVEFIMPGSGKQNQGADGPLLSSGISSLICMPARVGETTHGFLYLDNRLGGRPFAHNQLPYVRLLCNQIAVGLSSIRMYEEMRGLKDRFEDEAIFYKREMGLANPSETIIGRSEAVKTVISQIRQVAPTDSSVLIMGETGVGKELVAKAIHNSSCRKNGPFIPVNLAALPQDLVASELFGHEKGAFTGANERLKGRFELANGGTIFLDEIGDLPPSVQVKLLRVLEEGTFERLGSAKPIQSDFRVIAATHRDLYAEVGNGAFRQDLYYRLKVFPISIPSLRERKEDIPLIAHHFVDTFSRQMGKRIRRVPGEEVRKLSEYNWPGNVRELKHFVERAVILSDGTRLSFSGLERIADQIPADNMFKSSLADVERSYIEKVLDATHWRVSGPNGASAILGLKPTTLLFRMKKLGIRKPLVPPFPG
jgi:transcriptional regulator with GAF, ATPase, and Fis domain/tetratricopeptide (TPR) repeat protein